MKSISKDARGFVEGVVKELKKSKGEPPPKVESLLFKISERATHEHEAIVESAIALTKEELEKVTAVLTKVAGVELHVVPKINKHLIGGLRIRMADLVIDTSIRHQLDEMVSLINS